MSFLLLEDLLLTSKKRRDGIRFNISDNVRFPGPFSCLGAISRLGLETVAGSGPSDDVVVTNDLDRETYKDPAALPIGSD